jgi:trehalose-6-phosphate hydrolase
VDPTYGSLADFKTFRRKPIKGHKGNHGFGGESHFQPKWFQESLEIKDNPYPGYYIWKDKPNNWESFWRFRLGTEQNYRPILLPSI